ncbi:hypothetical protein HUT16_35975 [Kitasatospora sp. NA04385]|uniref:hypothetical protein n=1 Tax=Kitasatospora sp. NA04385 TaxID=2742135 RepID=UPI00158FE2E8|nr:hypothetical protein [Kitasatospora sp. NA04385]QKW23785.1 hypothetical protein HUT16_35975 [Kitasatospora sp. NA04385]
MDAGLREACVPALAALAGSEDYADRADAGRALAGFAELPAAARTLTALLADPRDTYVTLDTARALLRRGDRAATAILAAALADLDVQHEQYVCDAVREVLGVFPEDHARAVRLAEELARVPDARLAKGAAVLSGMLDEVTPFLGPA